MKKFTILILACLLTACTSAEECRNNLDADGDPFEACDALKPINQPIFSFNLVFDRWLMRPVAHTYHELPDTVRGSVDNFLTNLSEPSNVVNSALQGDMQAAGTSLWRFILNSTFGFAGLRDFAGENGLKYNDQDFGKTLGTYGVVDGSYVVLPVFGPSTLRDTTGKVVDWFLDPVGWYLNTPESITQDVADGIDTRDDKDALIQQLYYDSLDPYSATRSTYLQHSAYFNN